MSLKFENRIDFLTNYYKQLYIIVDDLKSRKILKDNRLKKYKLLSVVNYTELGDSWDISTTRVPKGVEYLIDKLIHMILSGNADNIKPMMQRISKNKVKVFKKPSYKNGYKTTNVGKGHFRCNSWEAYTLNSKELAMAKEILSDFF